MQSLVDLIKPYFKKPWFFKLAFNVSPMYRRSVGRVIKVSEDLHSVEIKIPINYKNRNYSGAIFGGSLFSATDPIMMIQLIQILGNDFVVWDKEASIRYKIPVREKVYALFEFTPNEIKEIRDLVLERQEIDITKKVFIKNRKGKIFAEVTKVLYVADHVFYKEKMKKRKLKSS
ncbi:DUF4442 domain-containing protein [Aquimarina sp. AD10]|uniref:DUF4442 domain-containing protein n=1 Tax=Aquimarina sp. AD10 TaxID=1714849 RepID=UPI000E5339F1|nr:DUF4442 domain-containing protein [Aquimarina sp. AD10]AXT63128.1 DUF4442 domain-containing protein [Aquimarina sp. AD10]RKM98657.1 DUF4442 domain-containing protein [Aquimarina sp. AD10]